MPRPPPRARPCAQRRAASRALLGGVLAAGAARLMAQPQPASDVAVKAAFLYNFLAYVDWPSAVFPAADTPLVVGVIGADALHAE